MHCSKKCICTFDLCICTYILFVFLWDSLYNALLWNQLLYYQTDKADQRPGGGHGGSGVRSWLMPMTTTSLLSEPPPGGSITHFCKIPFLFCGYLSVLLYVNSLYWISYIHIFLYFFLIHTRYFDWAIAIVKDQSIQFLLSMYTWRSIHCNASGAPRKILPWVTH